MSNAADKIAAAINETTETGEYQKSCDKTAHKEQSDLCAQWSAANAAKEAADYTKLAFFAGVVGAGFALAALFYTSRGTRAALRAVEAQLAAERPILTVETFNFRPNPDHANQLISDWALKNIGGSACWNEGFAYSIWIGDNFPDVDATTFNAAPCLIPQGDVLRSYPKEPSVVDLREGEREKLIKDRSAIIFGYCRYRNSAGTTWETHFARGLEFDEHCTTTDSFIHDSVFHWRDFEVRPSGWRALARRLKRSR